MSARSAPGVNLEEGNLLLPGRLLLMFEPDELDLLPIGTAGSELFMEGVKDCSTLPREGEDDG